MKKMSSKTLMSNAPKKIKNLKKPLEEYEDESEVNYFQDYEGRKTKTRKKKPRDKRKENSG